MSATQLPPGPSGPRFVNGPRWMFTPTSMMEAATRKYGDIWSLRLMAGTTMVAISHPELVEKVFTAPASVLQKGSGNLIGLPLMGKNSMLLLDEDEAIAMRDVLRPSFASEAIARHRETMGEACEEAITKWPLNQPIELIPLLDELTLNVIIAVLFGVRSGPRRDELRARLKTLFHYGDNQLRIGRMWIGTRRGIAPPKSFLAVRQPVDELLYDEIARARRDPQLGERDDLLAALVQVTPEQAGREMTDEAVRDTLMTMLVQGHASTATAIGWAIERLMRHPDAFERLYVELQTDSEEYLDAVIRETLRIRPPLAMVARQTVETFQLGTYELAPESLIAVLIWQVHHRPDIYPDPERFRPERFLEGSPSRYEWIPFGGGERACIGAGFALAEIKTVMRTLLQRARPTVDDPADEVIKRRRVLYRPGRGARTVLRPPTPAQPSAVGREPGS